RRLRVAQERRSDQFRRHAAYQASDSSPDQPGCRLSTGLSDERVNAGPRCPCRERNRCAGPGVEPDMQVEIWSDVVCPWCYLGKKNFERAVASLPFADEIEVTYRSFELDPSAPKGTTVPTRDALAAKYGLTGERADEAQQQMEQRA